MLGTLSLRTVLSAIWSRWRVDKNEYKVIVCLAGGWPQINFNDEEINSLTFIVSLAITPPPNLTRCYVAGAQTFLIFHLVSCVYNAAEVSTTAATC